MSHPTNRSRQSLNSPGGTEMDLLVMRERPRKGIRNSGYDVSVLNEKLHKRLSKVERLQKHSWQSMVTGTARLWLWIKASARCIDI